MSTKALKALQAALWGGAAVLGLVPPTLADEAPSSFPTQAQEAPSSTLCPVPEATAGLDAALREASAQALAGWITESRRTALHEGVRRMPEAIRAQLEGFVPREILDTVRWRVGGSGMLAMQTHMSRLGLVAVTLSDVVVFSDADTALHNPGLWAHELRHMMQYRECGIAQFARSYVHHYEKLEQDARDYALRWHRWSLEQSQAFN